MQMMAGQITAVDAINALPDIQQNEQSYGDDTQAPFATKEEHSGALPTAFWNGSDPSNINLKDHDFTGNFVSPLNPIVAESLPWDDGLDDLSSFQPNESDPSSPIGSLQRFSQLTDQHFSTGFLRSRESQFSQKDKYIAQPGLSISKSTGLSHSSPLLELTWAEESTEADSLIPMNLDSHTVSLARLIFGQSFIIGVGVTFAGT
ncbi:hypothetical protein N7457_002124 [Penicillium paradoxum]|uniref:uncharacterized protein n=1 Tax=Penicillium paradoxum TaxID=176176 RepID=UPI0025487A06|nr:uncharacterized protein N7457_002124 [Penicillium paradoxum]KAJ5787134.1 hypothetical protein N7457_002124 [Penicillium paradoxum]